MEELFIPDLTSLRRATKDCIDRPATISEVLRLRCSPQDPKKTLKVMNEAMGKLSRHDDRHNIPTNLTTLSSIVREINDELTAVVTVNGHKPQSRWFSSILRHQRNRYLRTIETLNMEFSKELVKDTRELMDLVTQHQDVIRSFRKAHRKCWISLKKASDHNIMLTSMMSSVTSSQGTLTTRQEQTRQRTIENMKNKTMAKREKHKDNMHSLWMFSSEEKAIRLQMIKLRDSIENTIKIELVDRLKTAISSLKELCQAFLPEERLRDLSQKFANFDARGLVKAIMSNGRSEYTFPIPYDHIRMHGFNKGIPTGVLTRH